MIGPQREVTPNIANLAALIGEPARAAMLWSLMGGESRPARELAGIAGLSPQAASAHLAQLVDGELLEVEPKGRHRYFRLSSPEAAEVIENLAAAASIVGGKARVTSFVPGPLRKARRCWGHLAGEMGVELHDALIRQGRITADGNGYVLTSLGRSQVEDLGVDLLSLRPARRGFLYPCLDWSERRPHLGGPMARALLDAMLAHGWFTVISGSRQLLITPTGDRCLAELCGRKLDSQRNPQIVVTGR